MINLICCFTLLDFCLRNPKFDISSREIMWEDGRGVHYRKSFLDMLKNRIY